MCKYILYTNVCVSIMYGINNVNCQSWLSQHKPVVVALPQTDCTQKVELASPSGGGSLQT